MIKANLQPSTAKRALVVIDLDHTLIGMDSFRHYLDSRIAAGSFTGRALRLLRQARLIGLGQQKALAIRWLLDHDAGLSDFAAALLRYLNRELWERIRRETAETGGEIVILSASPHAYVSALGEELGVHAQGSFYDRQSGRFYHLHGPGKRDFLLRSFPREEFHYSYAVSDSASDLKFLELFDDWALIEPFKISHGS